MSNKSRTSTATTQPSLFDRLAPIPAAVLHLVAKAIERSAERRARRAAVLTLYRLNDHELADIGLTRGEIEWAVNDARTPASWHN
jgi:uncharacterized protein YjiS (DUF1127 family)